MVMLSPAAAKIPAVGLKAFRDPSRSRGPSLELQKARSAHSKVGQQERGVRVDDVVGAMVVVPGG